MVHAVGGIEDHLHVLYDLPPTISRADSIRTIKANSSRWMTQFSPHFAWQKGSGAFSVSVSNKAAVMRYIADQREHHQKISFEDEFIALLKKHGIAYDPKYVFDWAAGARTFLESLTHRFRGGLRSGAAPPLVHFRAGLDYWRARGGQ
jgi:hypothetical protein